MQSAAKVVGETVWRTGGTGPCGGFGSTFLKAREVYGTEACAGRGTDCFQRRGLFQPKHPEESAYDQENIYTFRFESGVYHRRRLFKCVRAKHNHGRLARVNHQGRLENQSEF